MTDGDLAGAGTMASAQRPWRMLFTDAGEFTLPEEPLRRAAEAGIEIVTTAGHAAQDTIAHGAGCDGPYLFRARIDDAAPAGLCPHRRSACLVRGGAGLRLRLLAVAPDAGDPRPDRPRRPAARQARGLPDQRGAGRDCGHRGAGRGPARGPSGGGRAR